MAIFKGHKVSLVDIIREIPESELTRLSISTNVDHYTKVLSGKLVFYLLLYGMLRIDRLSQRGLQDAFSSPWFRTIFHVQGQKEISLSSISERLSVIEVDFFRQAYKCIYRHFSSLYTPKEISNLSLQRVDSTLVLDACNKLKQGLTCGNVSGKKKAIKYTINFDGMFASLANAYQDPCYNSETNALPENVMDHFKKEKDHSCVYVFDRGQSSAPAFSEMSSHEGLYYIGRLKENRRQEIVEEFCIQGQEFSHGKLLKDGLCQLYKKVKRISKNGKESHHSELVETPFRIIRFRPEEADEDIVLITNIENLSANKIAGLYRRRWDIEVFFRFLKQELNFSHFLSLNENGIQVVLYMTMITAMLVMIYKKENDLGYKTAIRRMNIELESLVMAIIVIQSGGDLKKTELPDP